MATKKTKAELQEELKEKDKELKRLENVEKKYKDSQDARWNLNKKLEDSFSLDYVKKLKDKISSLEKGESEKLKKKDQEIKELKNELNKRVPKEQMEKFNKYVEGLQPILNEYITAFQSTLKSFEGTLELAKQSEKQVRQKFGGNE